MRSMFRGSATFHCVPKLFLGFPYIVFPSNLRRVRKGGATPFFGAHLILEIPTMCPAIPTTCLCLRSLFKRSPGCVSGVPRLLWVVHCAFPEVGEECFMGVFAVY